MPAAPALSAASTGGCPEGGKEASDVSALVLAAGFTGECPETGEEPKGDKCFASFANSFRIHFIAVRRL